MKHLNFLSKSSSQSCGHSSVTLASTVGSPSVHRRGTMLKLISVLVLILTFGIGQMWGQASSQAPNNGSSYVVAVYSNSTYYALPNTTSNGGTLAGATVEVNNSGQVTTTNPPTWTLEEGTGTNAGKYYLKYTSGNNTYYLYKNGTGKNNVNFAVNATNKNYWSFTSSGTGYTVTAVDRGTNHPNIYLDGTNFKCNSNTSVVRLLPVAASGPTITKSSSMTTFGCNMETGVPNKQSFTVSGTNLKAAISVTPPSGYEICTTENGTYQSTAISLPKNGSNAVATTTIWVRLKASNAAGSYSGNISCTSTDATTQTIAVSGSTPFKVTWIANGQTHATTYVTYAANPGTEIGTFPDDPDPDDYTCSGTNRAFYGWYNGASYKNANTAPDIITTSTKITTDKTFNAVFADASGGGSTTKWVLTSLNAVTEGTYALMTGDYHAFNGSISSGKGGITTNAFSFTNGEATSAPTGTCEITFQAVTGGFKMYNSSNGYLYAKGNTSGNLGWHNSESSYWSYASSNWVYNSNSARLRSYNDGNFNTYSSDNGNLITLAKKTTVSNTTYSNYMTTCCTTLGQINGSVNLTQEANGANAGKLTASWPAQGDKTGWADNGLIVKIYKDGNSTPVHTSSAISKNYQSYTATTFDPEYCTTYYATLTPVKADNTYCEGVESTEHTSVTTKGQYTYGVSLSGMQLKDAEGNNEETDNCSDFDAIYEPTGTNVLSLTVVSVTNAGAQGTGWTWNSSTGALHINKASVTGNVEISITGKAPETPKVTPSPTSLDFGTSLKIGDAVPTYQTFTISGSNLTEDLEVASSNTSLYTVAVTGSLTPDGDKKVSATITVTPQAGITDEAGTKSANITISGGGLAEDVVVVASMTVQQTYTVNWYVNGTKIDANCVTDVTGTAVTEPSDFSAFDDCSELHFIGWKEGSAITGGSSDEKPTLETPVTAIGTTNKNYYAVFAEGTPASVVELMNENFANSLENDNSNAYGTTNGGSKPTNFTGDLSKAYAGANGTAKLGTSNDPGFLTSKQLDLSEAFTVSLKAKYYNTGGDNASIQVTVGSQVQTISKDDLTNSFKSFSLNFNAATSTSTIKIGTDVKRAYIDDVVVTKAVAEDFSKYYTTCPHCNTVTLEKVYGTNPANGSITLKQGNTEVSAPVETCEGDVTINVTNSPSLGYQLSTLIVNGVDGASVNAEKTQITIPQDGDGTLTVTATFVQSPSITVTDGVDPVTALNFGTPKKAAAVPSAQTFVISGANLTSALTVVSSAPSLYAVSYGEGVLTPTDGAVSATITVTPQSGITASAGEKNANITISGGGLANSVVITASMTVQETYTVKWWINNNTETPSASQTDVIDTDLEVPTVTPAGDCSELVFKGWLTAPLAETSATEPDDLITPTEIATMKIAGNANYYAVFATETPGDPTTATWVLTDGDFEILDAGQSSGYDKYKGDQEKDGITFNITDVMPINSAIQFKASAGMMYNKTAMPGDIISIAINGLDLDVYQGTEAISSTPGSGKITKANSVYPFSDGKRYFHIKKSTSGAGSATSITVTYHSVTASTYSNYVTTCPHCNSVTLEAAYGTNPANGSITLGKSEVKTCKEATVSIENTPDTGYELSTIALSNNITGASVNEAKTQITIPEGAPAGTLTVTATFAAIDYAVTMTQTGGANAELTGAKNKAHYGETINITAEDKEGYQFLGWEATPTVAFADASALNTSFTMPNEAVEVTANYAKICTVKFYVGTSESAYATQTPHAGETVDLSSVATPSSFDATNYPNFIGWSATNFGAAVVEPALITGSEIINDDANYYAVFGNALTVETNNYAKVTAIESGKNYLVVAEASDKFYAMKNTVVSSYYISSDEVAPVSNVITSDAAHKWQIAIPATGKMTIQNASAGYVYMYPGTGNYKDLGLQEEAYQFSYTLTEGKVQLEGLSDTYVQFTSNYKNFAAKDEASDLYLYKQIVNPTKWATKQIEEVTVSFNDNVAEEEIIVPANEVVESGSDLDLSGFTPGARAGYQFSGWSLTTNGAVVSSLSNITENTPLYAIWAINHKTTIKFYAKGSDDPIATHDQTQGLAYAIPDLSTSMPAVPQGFTFVGWSVSQINNEAAAYTQVTSVTPDVAEADNEMSLYAVYDREVTGSGDYVKVTTARADWSGQYLIVNEANNVAFNGNINGSFDVTNNIVSVSISGNTIAQSTSMDNASFTFAQVEGGYSIQSHSGYYIGRTSSSTGINATDEYNASYVNTPAKNSITAGNNYLLRYNDANDQKRFRYYSGESVKGIALYRKDDVENNYTTNPVVKYDITYLAGDAENVTGVCDADRQEAGNITLCDAPTCADKDFQGWNDGSQTYAAGAEYTLSADVTFTATWTPKPKYTVTYTANGGIGTAPAVEEYMEGDTVEVKENEYFSKPGFVYAGWQVVYNDGTDHIITPNEDGEFKMVAYNVTIKALWEEPSNQKWVRVDNTDELATDGTNYIIVASQASAAMGTHNESYYNSVGIVKTGNYLNGPESMTKVTLEEGSEEGKLAIKHGSKYIYSTSAKNVGERDDSFDWTITIAEGVATINAGSTGKLQFNTGSPRFTTYTSSQQAVAIYREKALTPIDHDGMTEADVNTYDDVEIGKDKTWTVSDDIEVGDVYMKEGAVIANSAEVTANDLYFKTQKGKSNQIVDASQLNVIGDLYYDVQLCDGNLDADYWYSIAVPFDVDLNSGVFQADGSPMTNRVDFEVWGYNTELRAQTQSNGWQRVSDNMMHAGKAYLIGFNPGQTNTIRLKAAANWKTNLFNGTSMQVVAAGSGDHANWNGLANPTMRYIDVNKKTEVFNNNTHEWDSYDPEALSFNFVVGTAFFVQSDEAVTISNTDHGNYRAPKRESENKCAFAVRITREDAKDFDNQIIVRASEDATGEYTQGHDMLTMNGTSSNTAALLWTENYGGKRLAIEEAAWLNGTATYELKMYAPKAGTYSISVAEAKANADLYLTYEGSIIWNLSESAYPIDLKKGTTEGYGLLLQAKAPGAATGVDNIDASEAAQKVIINDHVYILRNGQMYGVDGKAVK